MEGEPSRLTDYESVASGEPAARSVFDIYLRENTVAYLKSPCSEADVQAEFFLHVVPEDLQDLPADRRQHGFGGAHFRYGEYAALDFGGQCIMEQPLPDYPIARIRTGQLTPAGDRIWTGRVPRRRGTGRNLDQPCFQRRRETMTRSVSHSPQSVVRCAWSAGTRCFSWPAWR